eukprot:m.255389 g.255389  ORF g.255389 m.255389 type:complete len:349 (-) comp11011_c0_seq23:51-1097(-)
MDKHKNNKHKNKKKNKKKKATEEPAAAAAAPEPEPAPEPKPKVKRQPKPAQAPAQPTPAAAKPAKPAQPTVDLRAAEASALKKAGHAATSSGMRKLDLSAYMDGSAAAPAAVSAASRAPAPSSGMPAASLAYPPMGGPGMSGMPSFPLSLSPHVTDAPMNQGTSPEVRDLLQKLQAVERSIDMQWQTTRMQVDQLMNSLRDAIYARHVSLNTEMEMGRTSELTTLNQYKMQLGHLSPQLTDSDKAKLDEIKAMIAGMEAALVQPRFTVSTTEVMTKLSSLGKVSTPVTSAKPVAQPQSQPQKQKKQTQKPQQANGNSNGTGNGGQAGDAAKAPGQAKAQRKPRNRART